MKHRLKLFILLFCLSFSAFAKERVDSLIQRLPLEKNDSIKVWVYSQIAWELRKTKPEEALSYCNKGLPIAQKKNLQIGTSDIYASMGEAYRILGDMDKALEFHQKALEIRQKTKDIKRTSSSMLNMGVVFETIGKYTEALEYYNKTLTAKKEINDKSGLSLTLNNIAIVHAMQGNYAAATDYFLQALKYDEELKDTVEIATRLNNIALTYNYLKNQKKALQYYYKAMPLHKIKKDVDGLSRVTLNIGVAHYDLGNNDSALYYYKIADSLATITQNKWTMAVVQNNLGRVYQNLKQYEKALSYGFEGLRIREEIKDKNGIVGSYNNIAATYFHLKNYQKSIEFANKALPMAIELKAVERQMRAYEALAMAYKELGDYKKAFENTVLFKTMNDSLINDDKKEAITQMEMNYQFNKVKTADSVKNAEQAKIKDAQIIAQNAQIKQEQTQRYALYSGLILVIAFGGVMYNRFKVTKKQKDIIAVQKEQTEHQKEIIEEKQKEIIDSISYAKRIQGAILPPARLVKEYLPDSFILYKPKDIVAGDFYWVEKAKDRTIIVAADCTGHGVPGALVSVVCSNALNRAVKEFGFQKPGDILDKVKDLVVETFNRSEEEVKDGMDVSLLSIHYNSSDTEHVAEWAGANNPLWIIRNNELIEYKPDKQPIGQYIDTHPFTTHSLELRKGDAVYLFTDGFQDQFGKESGKKFKSAQMRKMLLSIQDKNMEEQKRIIDEIFNDWKGSFEQVDDVCMIGVRV